eukprot:gene5655-6840_t
MIRRHFGCFLMRRPSLGQNRRRMSTESDAGLLKYEVSTGTVNQVDTTGGPTDRIHPSLAMYERALFLFGGKSMTDTSETLYNDLHRLDPATSAWTQISPAADPYLPARRAGAHLMLQGSTLLLAGHADMSIQESTVYAVDLAVAAPAWTERLTESTLVNGSTAAFAAGGEYLYAYTADGGFYALDTGRQIYFPSESAGLLGARMRASAPSTTFHLENAEFQLPRAVVLDDGFPRGMTLRSSDSGSDPATFTQSASTLLFNLSAMQQACQVPAAIGQCGSSASGETAAEKGDIEGLGSSLRRRFHAAGVNNVSLRGVKFQRTAATETPEMIHIEQYSSSASCPIISDCAFSGAGTDWSPAVTMDNVACTAVFDGVQFTALNLSLSGAAEGSAIRMHLAGANLSECTFSNNTGGTGGALHAIASSVAVSHSTFAWNSARAQGGAIYALLTALSLDNTTFESNAASSGGALYAQSCPSLHDDGAVIHMDSCAFTSNTAEQEGGALFLGSSRINVTGTNASANRAAEGGVVSVSDHSELYTDGGHFVQNQASMNGGVVALKESAGLELRGATFESNVAGTANDLEYSYDGNGACVYAAGGFQSSHEALVENCTFQGNRAHSSGGVLSEFCHLLGRPFCPSFVFRNASILNNTAKNAGGAVFWTFHEPLIQCSDGSVATATLGCADWASNSVDPAGYGGLLAGLAVNMTAAPASITDLESGQIMQTAISVSLEDQYGQEVNWGLVTNQSSPVQLRPGSGETDATLQLGGSLHHWLVNGQTQVDDVVVAATEGVSHIIQLAVNTGIGTVGELTNELKVTVKACAYGTYLDGIACVTCADGHFINTSSNNAADWCPKCPAGAYSELDGGIAKTTCKECPVRSKLPYSGAASITECQTSKRIRGDSRRIAYYHVDLSCQLTWLSPVVRLRGYGVLGVELQQKCECPPGYRIGDTTPSVSGQAASLDAEQSVAFTCESCPAGFYSDQYSSSACTGCPEGTQNPSTGQVSLTACVTCAPGYYSTRASGTCTSCPANANDVSRVTCVCNYGYVTSGVHPDLTCEACGVGSYYLSSKDSCASCPAGMYSTTEAATSSAVCVPCAAGYISAAGASACTACPVGSTDVDRLQCVCKEGYFGYGDVCAECGGGQYSTVLNLTSCQ